jgi:hypothetical protein
MRIDHVTFINLDARPDRRAHMEATLAPCPHPHERIPAVRLDASPEASGLVMQSKLAGEAGIASICLSHARALRRLVERMGDGHGVVLEDDVRIDPKMWSRDDLLDALPDDWQIAMLTPRFRVRSKTGPRRFERDPFGGAPVRLKTSGYICTGAHFVVLRDRAAAEAAVERIEAGPLHHVDHLYVHNFRTYGFVTPLISIAAFGSDR